MKKFALLVSAVALPLAVPSVAHAQDAESTGARPYIGIQGALHDLNVDENEIDTGGFDLDDNALTYGVYGGVDFDLGSSAIVGVEGNFNLGNGPIDSEYGVA